MRISALTPAQILRNSLFAAVALSLGVPSLSFAACGATTYTWTGTSSNFWTTAANWTPAGGPPNTSAKNAVIVGAANTSVVDTSYTLACLDLDTSGMGIETGATLTLTGDYFRTQGANSFAVIGGTAFTLALAGTAAQTVTAYDTIPTITISNNTSVTFAAPNTYTTFTITGTTTTVYINANTTITNALTIPAHTTLVIGTGATLTAKGGITVNGTLTLDSGSELLMGSGTTLSVPAGGTLTIAASNGNAAEIDAAAGTYTFNVAGSLNLNWFKISHTAATGLNLQSGATVSRINNGDFHYPTSGGTNVTLTAGVTLPATSTGVSFFDENGSAYNFTVGTYVGSVMTISDWAGGIGGAAYSNPAASAELSWGSEAPVEIEVTNATASGSPPTTVAVSSGPTLFATFAFSLNQASTATNITSVTFTQYGTGASSDIDYIQVFRDVNNNCVYNAGTDLQVGGNIAMSGSPPTATVSFSAGQVAPSSTTPACIFVLAHISASAFTSDTLGFSIASTGDVTNDQGYSFSQSSGPPVQAPTSTVTGGNTQIWLGNSNTAWTTAANWYPGTSPTSTISCKLTDGGNNPLLTANVACLDAILATGGIINYNNTADVFSVYGSLTVQSGFTFTSATSGGLTMAGAVNQSFNLGTSFPGTVTIANTGSTGNNVVSVDNNSTVGGNLVINSGVFEITSGTTLIVDGNITVNSGATLLIQPGGVLEFGANGKTLTVSGGATLSMIGTASSNATITSSSTANAYTISVNGTSGNNAKISANYYSLSNLGVAGLTIGQYTTIDTSNYLLNGSFSYPIGTSPILLTLNNVIPPAGTSVLSGMSFNLSGSSATGAMAIKTNYNNSGNALTMNTYTGSMTGASYTTVVGTAGANYPVSWGTATNTINLTQNSTGSSTLNQGSTYTMGRFAFKQTQAGAGFTNANITSLRLTLTGTGSAADISQARIYYDAACSGSGTTLLGSGTFSGNPATVTFSGLSGAAVDASATTPPTVCIDVQYDISGSANAGETVGAEIAGMTDVVNDQSYAISGSTPTPVTLGSPGTIASTSTNWIGTTSTAWCTAANWSAGLPSATLSAVINSATNAPIISAQCAGVWPTANSVTINSGSLTMSAATQLIMYGSFSASGTFTQSTGTLVFKDTGSATTQTLQSGSNSFTNISFAKTLGGTVSIVGSTATISNLLTLPSGSNFTFQVPNGQTLTLSAGLTLDAGTFQIQSGGAVAMGNGQTITVAGGDFQTTGVDDIYPEATTNKATVGVSGTGTWGFTATSGTVDLTGFIFDYINTSGLNIGGTTTLANLNGGQFTHLSATYASVKAMQISTTGTIPATANDIGFNWGTANGIYPGTGGTAPTPSTTYDLVYSSGCGSQSMNFSDWYGDFYEAVNTPTAQTKVVTTSCTITMSTAASPVSLLSFSATGYDSAVSVDWMTGSELDHQGFNVYRSATPVGGYAQINGDLIRNVVSYQLAHGIYRFVDQGVTNGNVYYYYIEDVATNGTRTLHGPVAASPNAAAGPAPATPSTTNSGGSAPSSGNSPPNLGGIAIVNGSVVDLGNGVSILAQTLNSLRVQIVPPAPTFAASTWNAAYQTVSMPGYSSTLTAGSPQLLTRTILLEVDPSIATAAVANATVQTSAATSENIAPAPLYAPSTSGTLVPSWSPNAAAYASATYTPAAYYTLPTSVLKSGGHTYLQLTVQPLSYDAADQLLKTATMITLDINLAGATGAAPVVGTTAVPPAARENVLRIQYGQAGADATGLYQIAFDDLVALGLDGPFRGADTTKFRLYVQGTEVPIDVLSANGSFASGDVIRFYGFAKPTLESDYNEVDLSASSLFGESTAPLRVTHRNGDPTGYPANAENGSLLHAIANQDFYAMFDQPLGDGLDHLFWGMIAVAQGATPDSYATLAMPINMPALNETSTQPVNLSLYVQGGVGYSSNATHHVGIWVNNVPYMASDQTFVGTSTATLNFTLPAAYFFPGTNTVTVKVLGDLVPAGDYDKIYVDRLEGDYYGRFTATGGVAHLNLSVPNTALAVTGFTNPATVVAYDVTSLDAVSAIDLPALSSPDGGATYTAALANVSSPSEIAGRKIIVSDIASIAKPYSLELGLGYPTALKSAAHGADLLIIGPPELLDVMGDLIAQRQAQGLRVATARLDQIYAEFSNGVPSSQAIRDFITYTQSAWTAPAPRYVLFVGDATYDPRGHLGFATSSSVAPIPIQSGQFLDFGGDNWFVASSTDNTTPLLATGRIPTREPAVLSAYVAKLLAYERGTSAPAAAAAKSLVFISDSDQMGEEFALHNSSLASSAQSTNPALSSSQIVRSAQTNDSATRSAILGAFDRGPLVISYLGHGAEDRWAAADVFVNADASALTNRTLPIVLGLNCLNSYFYDADPSFTNLGESLVLNPNGGAVAFFGSTTLTAESAQLGLAQNFFTDLGAKTKSSTAGTRIGDLFLRSKLEMAVNAGSVDSIRSYMLFGDPSMPLPAAAYAAAPAASNEDNSSGGHGFFSCGTIDTGSGSGGGNGPGPGAMAEVIGLFVTAYLASRRKPGLRTSP